MEGHAQAVAMYSTNILRRIHQNSNDMERKRVVEHVVFICNWILRVLCTVSCFKIRDSISCVLSSHFSESCLPEMQNKISFINGVVSNKSVVARYTEMPPIPKSLGAIRQPCIFISSVQLIKTNYFFLD